MKAPGRLRDLRGTASLYGGFFLTGVLTVLLGPLIPELKSGWGITEAEAATLFVAQFATSSLGSIVSSFHLRRSLLAGYAAMAAGLVSLGAGGWPLARPALAMIGLGLGLAIPATNILVSLRNPHRRGASLNTLNLVWGLGAVFCPLLFAAFAGRWPVNALLIALAALAAAVGVVLAIAADASDLSDLSDSSDSSDLSETPETPETPGTVYLVILASMMFLYVGIETSIGGWLVELSDQLADERTVVSLLIGSGFWGALLAGRAGAAPLLRRLSEPALYKLSLATSGAGALCLFLADSRLAVAAGTVLAGAGLASIYPLTLAILTASTASTRSRGTGWVFALAGFGGAVLPWLTGRISGDSGLLRDGFLVPLAGLAMLTALFFVLSAAQSARKRSRAASTRGQSSESQSRHKSTKRR